MSGAGYSLHNAESFGWGADAAPDSGKVAILRKYVVGPTVLDVGCATGTYVDLLARDGFDATGLEAFPDFLREAARLGRKGHFVQGHVEAMPFADKSFETTVLFDVLEHVDDRTAFREATRVTRGRILVLVPLADPPELLRNNVVFQHHRDRTHLREYSIDELRELVAANGCVIEAEIPAYPVNLRGLLLDSFRAPPPLHLVARLVMRLARTSIEPYYSEVFLAVNVQGPLGRHEGPTS